MTQVSDAIVDATWQRLGALAPAEVAKSQRRCGKTQPELTGFVIAFTSEQRPDVVGLALYIFVAVMEMLRSASPRKLRKVRAREIEAAWAANLMLFTHRETGAAQTSPVTSASAPEEPHVLQYVYDALSDPEIEEDVTLSDEEFGHLFAVLKTVVDCLHRA